MTEQPKGSPDAPREDDANIADEDEAHSHFHKLQEAKRGEERKFDTATLLVAGGAFTVTASIAGASRWPALAVIAWAAWALAILVSLASYLFSAKCNDAIMAIIDAGERDRRKWHWPPARWIPRLNYACFGLLVTGFAAFGIFASGNVSNGSPHGQRKEEIQEESRQDEGRRGSSLERAISRAPATPRGARPTQNDVGAPDARTKADTANAATGTTDPDASNAAPGSDPKPNAVASPDARSGASGTGRRAKSAEGSAEHGGERAGAGSASSEAVNPPATRIFAQGSTALAWVRGKLGSDEAFGAMVGAASAFFLVIVNDWRRLRKTRRVREVEEVNVALYAIFRMWNELKQFQREIIEPARKNPVRWFAMRPTPALPPQQVGIDVRGLLFLMRLGKAPLIGELLLAEQRYTDARYNINHRSELHTQAQDAMAANGIKEGQQVDEATAVAAIGPPRAARLKALTEGLIENVDETLTDDQRLFHEIRKAAVAEYGTRRYGRILNLEFGTQPTSPRQAGVRRGPTAGPDVSTHG